MALSHLGGKVHDNADPRVQIVLARGVGWAQLRLAACSPPLLDGSRHGEGSRLGQLEQILPDGRHREQINLFRMADFVSTLNLALSGQTLRVN